MQVLRGEIQFQLSSYDDAAKTLHKAVADSQRRRQNWPMRDHSSIWRRRRRMRPALSEKPSPSGHFVFRYRRGKDEVLIPYASAALDQAWAALAQTLPIPPIQKRRRWHPIRVEIYEEIADLARVSTLTLREIENLGDDRALQVEPADDCVAQSASARLSVARTTLTHEYTHYIVSRASDAAKFRCGFTKAWPSSKKNAGAACPAAAWPGDGTAFVDGAREKRLITFEQMSPSMAKLPSQEDTALAFAEVFTFVEYLHSRGGFAGIRALVKGLSEGLVDSKALQTAFGVSFDELDHGWRASLRNRPNPKPSWVHLPKAALPKSGSKATAAEEDESGDISDPKVRGFVRLGGLLRSRGRLPAAAFEYEKAATQTGTPHPLIALKLGRTYLDLNDAEKAVWRWNRQASFIPRGRSASRAWHCLSAQGRPAKAEAALEAAIATSPFDPNVHCGLKAMYEQSKNPSLPRPAKPVFC